MGLKCCRRMSTLGVCVSRGGPTCIRYGMGAIKGVGAFGGRSHHRRARKNGPFKTLPDLCRRIDLQRVNRRVFEALIRSGSLDQIGPNRASLTRNWSAPCIWENRIPAHQCGPGRPVRIERRRECYGRGLVGGGASGRRARNVGPVLERPSITPYEPDLKFVVSARLADVGGQTAGAAGRCAQLVGRQARHGGRLGAGNPPRPTA